MITPCTKNYQQWYKFFEINWKYNQGLRFRETIETQNGLDVTRAHNIEVMQSLCCTWPSQPPQCSLKHGKMSTLQRMCKYEVNVGVHQHRPSVDRSGNPRWESCRHVSCLRSETRQTVTGILARNAPVQQQQTDWLKSIKSSKNSSISWLIKLSFVAASATDHIFIPFCAVCLPAAVP